MEYRSEFERKLKEGKFVLTAEVGPPKGVDPNVVREKGLILKDVVDAVNVTDCQTAVVRMSSVAGCVLLRVESIEPVMQMTCRDRNRIGLQSDLLGAHALGVRNVLCLTGDHQKFGDHPHAKGVFDMDSIQLLNMLKNMNAGVMDCGSELSSCPQFFLGAAENPFADPLDFRAIRLKKKIEAGAEFIQTQIVYDVPRFKEWMKMVRDMGLHEQCYILPGVTPIKSPGMAKYMKKFVPGMLVPDEYITRMEAAEDKKAEGIKIAAELCQELREIEGVKGIHIMAVEWEEAVPEIVKQFGNDPQGFE